MSCTYIPQITAEFGRVITDHEIDNEFQAIERAFACMEEQIGTTLLSKETIYNHGLVDNSYTIDPAFGIIHYLEIMGDTELTLSPPEPGTSRLIALVIANVGSTETDNYGRFNFKTGVTWSAGRDVPMDGKPWNMFANTDGTQTGVQYDGFYGGVVQCLYDGTGWVFLVYARHHLMISGALNPAAIYNWR